jgi:16S rRNA C1402 N4-methylase RsmH
VKQFFNQQGWKEVTKKPIIAGRDEIEENSRSKSAKLRIAQKIA